MKIDKVYERRCIWYFSLPSQRCSQGDRKKKKKKKKVCEIYKKFKKKKKKKRSGFKGDMLRYIMGMSEIYLILYVVGYWVLLGIDGYWVLVLLGIKYWILNIGVPPVPVFPRIFSCFPFSPPCVRICSRLRYTWCVCVLYLSLFVFFSSSLRETLSFRLIFNKLRVF